MNSIPMNPLKPGLVNIPGATPASRALVVELLHKDVLTHYCYFNDEHFHNHLSHHILSIHDVGATAECIQAMYDEDAKIQRPLHPDGKSAAETNRINETNWMDYLGEGHADKYPDHRAFFCSEIVKYGVPGALERYLFSPEANGNGTLMLTRFLGGVLHPIIQTGMSFGIEFGLDFLVAEGLALTAVTEPEGAGVMDMPSGLSEIKSGPSMTLFALLREMYDSPRCAPPAYPKTPFAGERLEREMMSKPDRGVAIREIYSKWTFEFDDDKEIDRKIEECMWQATLLVGGTSKADRTPRIDFFLMHLLTGALLLRAVVDVVKKPLHKAQLLQAYARTAALFVVMRGRPRINSGLAMSYPEYPVPVGNKSTPLGKLGAGSPWLALLNNATVHSEAHVIKSIRALYYCAQHYGNTPAGAVVGAVDEAGKETHAGAAKLDGTLFVRVANVLTDRLGWAAHGEEERFWDFSGIGWEEAWSSPDDDARARSGSSEDN